MSLLFIYAASNPLLAERLGGTSRRFGRNSRQFFNSDSLHVLEFFRYFCRDYSTIVWFIENYKEQHVPRGTVLYSFCTEVSQEIARCQENWFSRYYLDIRKVERFTTILRNISSRYVNDIINVSFAWANTPQGHDYWSSMNARLIAYLEATRNFPNITRFTEIEDVTNYVSNIAEHTLSLRGHMTHVVNPVPEYGINIEFGEIEENTAEGTPATPHAEISDSAASTYTAGRFESRLGHLYYIDPSGTETEIMMGPSPMSYISATIGTSSGTISGH